MPTFKAQKRVNVPPDVAYDVAADVGQYHEFLPLLERSSVLGAKTVTGGITSFKAELVAGYAKLNIHESFVSDVTCERGARRVTATSQKPPFKQMKTVWIIHEVNGQSDVSITIDYAMRSMMTQLVLASVMDMAVNKVMTAFEKRALAKLQERVVS